MPALAFARMNWVSGIDAPAVPLVPVGASDAPRWTQPVTVTLFAFDDVAGVCACIATPTPVAETKSASANVFIRPPIN